MEVLDTLPHHRSSVSFTNRRKHDAHAKSRSTTGAAITQSPAWLLRALQLLTSCHESPPLRRLALQCSLDRCRPTPPTLRSLPGRPGPTDPRTPALALRRAYAQGEKVSQSVHRRMYLRALLALGYVVAAPRAALRSGAQSSRVEDGRCRSGCPPSESRKRTPKSWTISSNTPALSHRCVCW